MKKCFVVDIDYLLTKSWYTCFASNHERSGAQISFLILILHSLFWKELYRAKKDQEALYDNLREKKQAVKISVPEYLLPSVAFHSRQSAREVPSRRLGIGTTKNCLNSLKSKPDHCLTSEILSFCTILMKSHQGMSSIPSLGPKNSVLEKFNPHDVLAELDGFLNHCKEKMQQKTWFQISTSRPSIISRNARNRSLHAIFQLLSVI